jgi:hypothetical protein
MDRRAFCETKMRQAILQMPAHLSVCRTACAIQAAAERSAEGSSTDGALGVVMLVVTY